MSFLLWLLSDSYCRSADMLGHPLRFCQHTRAAISDECWTLLPDRDAGCRLCPFSVCSAAQRCAVRLNAAGSGQRGPSSWPTCWDAAVSYWSYAFTAQYQQRMEGGQKGWLILFLLPSLSCHCSPYRNVSLITFLQLLSHRDVAPTLQVVSREVYA